MPCIPKQMKTNVHNLKACNTWAWLASGGAVPTLGAGAGAVGDVVGAPGVAVGAPGTAAC